ncbi:glycosyltransferase [Candidatus Pacearchaeota archaeon]|nr:glycosyltransferase [Candidatus Pacearchaeota archaeon]
MEKNKILFSIIIPVKEFNDYLKESIPKLLAMDYSNYEIIILPNTPCKTPPYARNKKIRVVASGKVSPAIKRDLGAKESKGKYLAFIDDDAYPEKNWLKIAEKIFREKKVSAIGGPALTPKNNTSFQKASGLFFETIFGGGGMSYRYKPGKRDFYVQDYPTVNLIVSKKDFQDVGGFDNEYWPGEDTKFCLDLTKKGHKILYSKDLIVYHHRRENLRAHLKQIGNYGKHRGYFAKKFPETSFKLTYFAPSLFLIGNLILLLASIFSFLVFSLWVYLIIIYFILILLDTLLLTRKIRLIVFTVAITFLSHLFYGYNFLKGILSKRIKSQLR